MAWRAGCFALVLVGLGGCIGAPPAVLKGDDSFVTVSHPAHTDKSATNEVAEAYCKQRGKRATFLSDACPQVTCTERALTYWCQ